MRRKQIAILLVNMLFFCHAFGQEKLKLTIQSAKEYALDYNRTIISSKFEVQQSKHKVWEAIAAGLPHIDAKADYSNALGADITIQFDENAPASKIPIKPTSNFNLQVGQLIFSGSYFIGVQTSKLAKKMTEVNLEKTEQDVVSMVADGYFLVLVAEESLNILRNNIKNLEEVYAKTEPMVKVGMIEEIELDQLSVQVNSIRNAVKSAERQYEMAKNLLRIQLGVSADTQIELTEKLNDLIDVRYVNNTNSIFEVDYNIDYQLLKMQEQIYDKQVNLQKTNYLPTITGFYNYTEKILKPAFDMSPKHIVGLQMNIPIFSSGERLAKVRQAKMDLEIIKNNRELLKEQLNIQYEQLRFNLKNAKESYQTQKKNVEVSREVYKNLKRKYNQGMISGLELTTADNNYLKAESDYLKSVLEVLQAQNELDLLTGKILNN